MFIFEVQETPHGINQQMAENEKALSEWRWYEGSDSSPDRSGSPEGGTTEDYKRIAGKAALKEKIQHLQYEYDVVGNIVKKKNLKQPGTFFGGSWTSSDSLFLYDPMYRLVEATGREHLGQTALTEFDSDNQYFHQSYDANDPMAWTEFNEQYSYDKVGNILQLKHRSQEEEGARFTRNYLYADANNQLLDIAFGTTPSGSTFGYDAQGNCTQMPSLPTMGWDVLGRMDRSATQVVSSGLPETTWYQYDLQGNRVRKITTQEISENWVTTMPTLRRKNCRYYVGDWELYRTYTSGGAVNKETFSLHISDETGRFALIEVEGTTVRTRYQHSDHLGSSCLETDEEGEVISYEEYHPFGTTAFQATLSSLGSAAKRYRYCGRERDEESGLYYYGARYYASWLGRFVSVDPKESKYFFQSSYAYAENSPVTKMDFNGEGTIDDPVKQTQLPISEGQDSDALNEMAPEKPAKIYLISLIKNVDNDHQTELDVAKKVADEANQILDCLGLPQVVIPISRKEFDKIAHTLTDKDTVGVIGYDGAAATSFIWAEVNEHAARELYAKDSDGNSFFSGTGLNPEKSFNPKPTDKTVVRSNFPNTVAINSRRLFGDFKNSFTTNSTQLAIPLLHGVGHNLTLDHLPLGLMEDALDLYGMLKVRPDGIQVLIDAEKGNLEELGKESYISKFRLHFGTK